MNEQRFETGQAPQVTVRTCGGSLVVGSWKGTAVLAQGANFTAETPKIDQITLSSKEDMTLTVPEKTALSVETVTGSLTIKHVDGRIAIGTVDGNITLNDVGRVKIKQVGGKLHGENINDPLTVAEVGQAVTLRNVVDVGIKNAANSVAIQFANGAVLLEQVKGTVTLHTISGDVIVRQAGEANLSNLGGKNEIGGLTGTLRLAGGLANGEHHFAADGDIFVAWPPDSPVTLTAKAALIDNQLPLTDVTETAASTSLSAGVSDQITLTGHIKNGKPIVSLKTAGNIGLKLLPHGEHSALTEADFDFTPPPTLAEIVGTAVRQHLPDAAPEQIKQITAAIKTNLATPPPPATPSPPSAGKIAAEKAQRKVEESLQKVKETMAKAEGKLTLPSPGSETAVILETKPDEDTAVFPSQTQILKLLKSGQINVKQANLLLDNLRNA